MDCKRLSVAMTTWLTVLLAGASIAWAVEHPPDVNPANFNPNQAINNPYFPQPVGTLFVYEGTTEGVPTHDEICVTTIKKTIAGVQTTEVHHRSFELVTGNLVLVEDTKDWFAQDMDGNVWYFGEDTVECPCPPDPGGNTAGSWEAGVADADAGFIMLADPQVGVRYYQEFARNVAEDQAKVLSRNEVVTVGGVIYHNVLLTKETSRLDPAVVEYKYYAPNVGFILAEIVKGGNERTELVSKTPNSGCN